MRDAKRLLKQGRRAAKKHRKRVEAEKLATVATALDELEKAIKEVKNDPQRAALSSAYHRADTMLERHLGFAQKSAFREYTESILFAVIFALILRAFVVEAFKIPTKSMVPTLLEGDHLFVNKFTYGIRIPFTTTHLVHFAAPQRGEVVVFVFPREQAAQHLAARGYDCLRRENLEEDKDYIKRIIGLPGDTIEIRDGIIHINGEPVERRFLYERKVPDHIFPNIELREVWSLEKLGDAEYTTISMYPPRQRDNGPFVVQPDHVFVMGDNRDNSSDSRCWGQVPIENIKGKAMIIWWSSGPEGARWNRIFDLIE
ncbi:MAG: signal peptidase I [Myxococcota bacterium]|nr:signal peptidase I [Myxococcota bacterium]